LSDEFLEDYYHECYLSEIQAEERIADAVESIAPDGTLESTVDPEVLDALVHAWYPFRYGWDVALLALGADALPPSWRYRDPRPRSELGTTSSTPELAAARNKAPLVDPPIFTSELYSRRYRDAVETVRAHGGAEAARLVSEAVSGRSLSFDGGRARVADENYYVGFLCHDEVRSISGPVATAARTTNLPEARLALETLSGVLVAADQAQSGLVVVSM
jgi:hypothetical protein